jgi:hypothetical protein
MSNENTAGGATPAAKAAVQADKHYSITLARAIEVAPKVWARPGDHVTMDGDQIPAHGDAIESYEEV